MAKSIKPERGTLLTAGANTPLPSQVAALCWRQSPKGLKILLITSRDTGRWVIPKGWPMHNRTPAQAAAREAYEEAGLRGVVDERLVGIYTYRKSFGLGRRLWVAVRVFPLEVRELLRKYPEIGQRKARWFSPEKAARRVSEPELSALILHFDPADFADREAGHVVVGPEKA